MSRRFSKRKRRTELSRIRERQRAHAKRRFQQRFALSMNRDRLRQIEQAIATGRVVLVERMPGIRNYVVSVEGKLIVVGYNKATKRVVTALPEDYLNGLPPEVILLARSKLLGERLPDGSKAPPETQWEPLSLDDATSWRLRDHVEAGGSVVVWRANNRIAFHEVELEGYLHRFGYDKKTGMLCLYRDPPPRRKRKKRTESQPADTAAPTTEPPAAAE